MATEKALLEIERKTKEKVDNYLLDRISNSTSRGFNYPSDLGFECDTYHALCRLKGNLRPKISLGLKKIFRGGDTWETPNIRLLQDAGIELKDRIGTYHWEEYQIKGRLDSWIDLRLNGKTARIPFEHKTASPNSYRAILRHKQDGIPLTKSKYSWLRKYPGQLQTYELQMGVDMGMWMYFEKSSCDYFFWLLPLDYEYAESLVKRAERCNENVKNKVIPEPERKDICNGCDFSATHCFVGKDYGEGFDLISDEELELMLNRWLELKPEVSEFNEIEKELKRRRGRNMIVGDVKLEWTEYETSHLVIPDELKAKYTVKGKGFRKSIERI